MFEAMDTSDLIRIAAAGGGFRIGAASRDDEDLIRIAAAASGKGARIYMSGLGSRELETLIRIAAAGKGSVVFDD